MDEVIKKKVYLVNLTSTNERITLLRFENKEFLDTVIIKERTFFTTVKDN